MVQVERAGSFFWHRLRWQIVSEFIPAGSIFRLVDVGAGAGLLGEALTRDFPLGEYCFVEPIAFLEHSLEQRYGKERNYAERSFQGINYLTLLDVLEHQEDDRRFLKDLVEKLDVGTTMFLTVPALMSLWSTWDESLGHYRRYNLGELRHLLDALPLNVLEVTYIFPELVPAAYIRKLWRAFRPHFKSATEFPNIPRLANEALYMIGRRTLAQRRRMRAGTSLFAVAVRVSDTVQG